MSLSFKVSKHRGSILSYSTKNEHTFQKYQEGGLCYRERLLYEEQIHHKEKRLQSYATKWAIHKDLPEWEYTETIVRMVKETMTTGIYVFRFLFFRLDIFMTDVIIKRKKWKSDRSAKKANQKFAKFFSLKFCGSKNFCFIYSILV